MPKIKPLLLFIIISIALHWWVLSLPIFQRTKLLEKTSSANNTPTIVAKLSIIQAPLEQQIANEAKTSTKAQESAGMPNQQLTAPLPPVLHGSPWLRRPVENRSRSFEAQPPIPPLTQIENLLQAEAVDPISNLQCKRVGIERLFICQGSNNIEQSEKIARAINQIDRSLIMQIPHCIDIEAIEKKWHAKACHS